MQTVLAPHQERVVNEKHELDEKREKLSEFLKGNLFKTLEGAEKRRLQRQLRIMNSYSQVLTERIWNFK